MVLLVVMVGAAKNYGKEHHQNQAERERGMHSPYPGGGMARTVWQS
jgi:hypothetical protein